MGPHILTRNPPPPGVVFVFPGQSSVSPDALTRARAAHPAADAVAGLAASVLGEARAHLYLDSAGAGLHSNRDIQITVFLATQMYLAALRAEGIQSAASLGLSLGEYSHIVDIDALDVAAALRLVDARGRCYDEAPPGVMATVLAVDRETVTSVVADAQAHGPVVVSNINAPTQHVIAGSEAAVSWATAILEDEHAAHVTIIERRVPMHSPLMAPVAQAFRPALAAAPWQPAAKPYLPNVTASPMARPTAGDFIEHLTRHVSEPVLWQHSLDRAIAAHPGAAVVEVGPGGVLHNMMGRAWRGIRSARVDAPQGAEPRAHFAATVEALRA
jgi:malonyl CoA-acyl carrier protein transacylase